MEALLNGLKFSYTDSLKTTAPAVVFIHGFPLDQGMWKDQARLIEPDFRVIAYDQRGHGKTGPGNGQFIFEDLVDDFFALLDLLAIKRAIVCGLSMGGYLALRAVERSPERIQGLILCDTRSQADSNEAKLKRAANIRLVRERGVKAFAEAFVKGALAPSTISDQSETVQGVLKTILATPPEGICATLIALATRTDTTGNLPKIKVPTLILVGEKDAITPPDAATAMHDQIQGSQMVVIPKAGHFSNIENPAAFNKSLLTFLHASFDEER